MSTIATPAAAGSNTGTWVGRLPWLALLAAAALVYQRTVIELAQEWWNNPDYSHGLLVPFAIGYIVHQKWDQIRSLPIQGSWAGLVLIVLSQAINLVGFVGAEFFLQRSSLVLLLAGLVLFCWGWRHLWDAFFALVLLQLSIPLPQIVFNLVALPLQLIASAWAEASLHLLKIPVYREGNILLLPNTALSVAEACSGIRSLMSLITVGVLIAYFMPTRTWVRALFVLSTVPVAIVANAFRVSGTGVLAHYYGAAAAQGFFHTFSGWLVFLFAFCFLMVEVTVLVKLFGNEKPVQEAGA